MEMRLCVRARELRAAFGRTQPFNYAVDRVNRLAAEITKEI